MQDAESVLESLQTLRDFVRWAASRFNEAGLHFGHGTDNALDEAAALMLHTLHLGREIPEGYWNARLTRPEAERFLAQARQRVEQRMPLPYVTQEAWFCGLPFFVDQRVLIPRSPLAELIETGFSPWVDPEQVGQVLDIGTGSGCIAIACALAFDEAMVDAVDTSDDALAVARENCRRHAVQDRVQPVLSDVYDRLPAGRRYDVIVSNPPYVDAKDMQALPAEYGHEPRAALAAGDDGLTVVRRILAGAAERLNAGGLLVVEVGNSAPAVERTWPALPFLWLEFSRGGHGAFLLTEEQLRQHASDIDADTGH